MNFTPATGICFRYTEAEEAEMERAEMAAEMEEADFGLDPERFIPESQILVNPEWAEIPDIADFDAWAEQQREWQIERDFDSVDLDPWGPNWN